MLSKTLTILPTVKIEIPIRLADFHRFGYAIAEAMGGFGENFNKAIYRNKERQMEVVDDNFEIVRILVDFLKENDGKWSSTVEMLHKSVKDFVCLLYTSGVHLDYIALGKRIREERLKLNLTQEKLAEDVDLSTAYIGQIERGERHITLENLVLIVNRLDITVDYILMDSVSVNSNALSCIWNQLMNGRTEIEKSMAVDTVKLIFGYLDHKGK